MNRVRAMYEELLANGELLEIFPELNKTDHINNWVNDKHEFVKLYEMINRPPNQFVDFEEL